MLECYCPVGRQLFSGGPERHTWCQADELLRRKRTLVSDFRNWKHQNSIGLTSSTRKLTVPDLRISEDNNLPPRFRQGRGALEIDWSLLKLTFWVENQILLCLTPCRLVRRPPRNL
jgi:hypothetical protein